MSDIIYKFGWPELIFTNTFILVISLLLFFMSVKLWHKSFKLTGSLLPIEGNGEMFNSKFLDSFHVLFMFLMSSFLFLLHTIHLMGVLYSIIANDSEIIGKIVNIEENDRTEIIDISGIVFENELRNRSRPWCFGDSFMTLNDSNYYKITIAKKILPKTKDLSTVCILEIKKI